VTEKELRDRKRRARERKISEREIKTTVRVRKSKRGCEIRVEGKRSEREEK
jgi:hypothetical protein